MAVVELLESAHMLVAKPLPSVALGDASPFAMGSNASRNKG
jgi:hypothetical protein